MRSLIKRTGKLNKSFKRAKRVSALYMIPSVAGVLLFFVLPFLVVIYYSVVNNPVKKEFVFLDNFKAVIANKAFRLAVLNTVKFSVVSVPLVVLLSLMIAVILTADLPGKSRIRSALLSPMMVPIASVILIWQVLFHYNGVVNEFLSRFDVGKIDWFNSDYAQVIIIILFVWKNLGYNMVLFMAALAAVPVELIEVACLEGANKWKIFLHIKVRYMSSSILFVTILSIINSFKVFREIYLLTGDYPYDSLYMMQHYMNNMFRSLDYQRLSAAAILMSLVMIVLIGVLFIIEDVFGRDIEG